MAILESLSDKLGRTKVGQSGSYPNEESGEDTEGLLTEANTASFQRRQHTRRRHWSLLSSTQCAWIVQIILLCVSTVFFIGGLAARRRTTDQNCAAQLSAYSPGIEAVEYEMVQFDAFGRNSPYKGQPSPQLDAAWEELVNLGTVKLSVNDMASLRKPLSQVKITEEDGDWYMAGVEVFHQLHCLQFIRQYTYFDYYSKFDPPLTAFRDSEKAMREHVDHCIDRLRQAIQCNGDVGVYTHSWVETRSAPYPDFAAWHRCRKLEPLNRYMADNAFPRWPNKSEAEVVLSKPPCIDTPSGVDCP